MNDTTDPTFYPNVGDSRASSRAPRIAGYRYATPTGEPCPRTVHVDGTIENNGICQSCGTCLLFGGIVEAGGDEQVAAQA